MIARLQGPVERPQAPREAPVRDRPSDTSEDGPSAFEKTLQEEGTAEPEAPPEDAMTLLGWGTGLHQAEPTMPEEGPKEPFSDLQFEDLTPVEEAPPIEVELVPEEVMETGIEAPQLHAEAAEPTPTTVLAAEEPQSVQAVELTKARPEVAKSEPKWATAEQFADATVQLEEDRKVRVTLGTEVSLSLELDDRKDLHVTLETTQQEAGNFEGFEQELEQEMHENSQDGELGSFVHKTTDAPVGETTQSARPLGTGALINTLA